ncbi:hypothetical protein [Krasilnikovia sp. M28-CT-15]|uniref:hypothetical protein n=1 Tax=Krasilnikovia sp. M28-CT-15 TaxID=3373540 RepID=UPI0038775BB4
MSAVTFPTALASSWRDPLQFRARRVAVWYLAGTYVAFLVIGRSAEVPDLFYLTAFIAATIVVFCLGYALNVSFGPPIKPASPIGKAPIALIVVCALYFLALGGTYLQISGVTNPLAILNALVHPGEAYFNRLQAENAPNSPVIQVLTLTAGLYPLLIPLAVFHWQRLTLAIRWLVLLGIGIYAAYYIAIGTQKGLGDLVIFWVVSYAAKRAADRADTSTTDPKPFTRGQKTAVALVVTAFVGYMCFNQVDRLQSQNQESNFPPNPIIAAVLPESAARGLTLSLSYPVHGYLGLAYNLETPFQWTYGLGSSMAIGSYWHQYTGGDNQVANRYTARTERLSGWPDGMFWSTIYPWLASDLTYPGAVLFMGIAGWFLAKMWRDAVYRRRMLSLSLLCQLALFIAFVPANNQIGQGRPSLVAFVTTALLSLAGRMRREVRASRAGKAGARLHVDTMAMTAPPAASL